MQMSAWYVFFQLSAEYQAYIIILKHLFLRTNDIRREEKDEDAGMQKIGNNCRHSNLLRQPDTYSFNC